MARIGWAEILIDLVVFWGNAGRYAGNLPANGPSLTMKLNLGRGMTRPGP
jgi:hypothetical protein